MIRFLVWLVVFLLVLRVAQISLDDDYKAKFNKCRDGGGTVSYCLTGLKL